MNRAQSDKNIFNPITKVPQLSKLFSLKFNSTLYRYKTKNMLPFSSKNSPIQPEYFLRNGSGFNEKGLRSSSTSARQQKNEYKDKELINEEDKEHEHKEKEATVSKAKFNMDKLHIFKKVSTTIEQLHKDLFAQMKENILAKKVRSMQMEGNVYELSANLAKSNQEIDQTKETTYLAETSAMRLSCNLKRALLQTAQNDEEIRKTKELNETMKNAIETLDKEKIILVNTIQGMIAEIEEMEYQILTLPKICDMIDNDTKTIRSSIIIIQKKRDEAILDMKANDTRVGLQYQQINDIVKDYMAQLCSNQ